MYRAAVPVTYGAAMEVPVMTIVAVSEAKLALVMLTPGACKSTQLPLHHTVLELSTKEQSLPVSHC